MLFRFHPLALGLRLLFTTMTLGVVISLVFRPYVGFLVVIVGVGGVLVAIRFALALVRYWDKLVDGVYMKGFRETLKRIMMLVFLFLCFASIPSSQKFLNLRLIFFNVQWRVSVFFVGGVLFLSVVVVVFIVKGQNGTLVDFKVK